ncbi:MAG TPA: proteasome subunit beta [Nanoarchaeota archaeon]|nr:proteasome subunit beta [Candidatus Pacearchaeota archaeon]HIH34561.1 proteasome subunit beta [Nanoarchaeota archaeon]HIH51865.1 proteasome subunit beta [Nanoarchaeota archaeon]HIH66564.1 proteasome subunit beta [Nanoarchaeota archaeon]
MLNDELKGQLIKTGTTTIGIVCKDGIILAADKKATADYFVAHSKVDKIIPITKNIAVTTAGLVSDIQLICKLTKAELKLKKIRTKNEPTVKEAANLFSTILYHNIRKFSPFLGVAAFIVGGVDDNGHWLYDTAPDGAALEYKDFVSTGSGSILAYGVLESEYTPDLTLKDGVKLALKAINSSVKRDIASGGGVDVITITKEGIKKVFTEELKMGLSSSALKQ